MKLNRNTYIALAAVVIVLLGIGSYFFFTSQNNQAKVSPTNSGQEIKKLQPSDIGLKLTVRPDKKGVIMKITKLEGISSLEYSLSYDANVTEEGQTAVVPRGVEGSPIQVKEGDSEITRDLDLGTCSRNVCKYDDVVSDITVTIRVNFKDGSVGGVETKVKFQ